MNHKKYILGLLLTSAGAIGWGISGVCGQYLFMKYNMDSAWLTAIRMVLSGILLLLLVLRKEKRRTFQIFYSRRDRIALLAFALIGLLMCQYTFLDAIKYSNSATATVLQSLNVVIMSVLMALWMRTPIRRSQAISVLLAILGTFLIATGGKLHNMRISGIGLFLGIMAAVGVVTYTLLSQRIIEKWSNSIVTGWGMLIGGTVLFVSIRAWNFPSNLDGVAWLMIAIIVVVGTAAGFSLFLEGVKYIGPVKATFIGCLEPASATLLSTLFLGTRFSLVELIGFSFVILTVFLATLVREV